VIKISYQTRNIIVGAAAIYVSTLDSTSEGWLAPADVPASPTVEAIVAGQGGPSLPKVDPTVGGSLVAALEASADWRHVGFTSEGIELSYDPSYYEVGVDQLLDVAKMGKESQSVSVNTTLTEGTLENLLIAWGQQNATLGAGVEANSSELGIAAGQLGDEPTERVIVFVGPGPRGSDNLRRERVYLCRRALQVESSSHALRRTEATTIPVSFRLLPDPLFVNKEYGFIRDRRVLAPTP
jgi:hypothetical protein